MVLVVDLPPDCEPFSGGGDTHPVEIITHTRNRLKNTTARLAINVYCVSFNKFGFDEYVSLSMDRVKMDMSHYIIKRIGKKGRVRIVCQTEPVENRR